jgi:dephospho-CoA kinase
MPRIFSLTGGIASGKSTVSGILRDQGVSIVDADIIAREVVIPGSPGLAAIVAAFGEEVLLPDGNLDRKGLGKRVFSDPAALCQLDTTLGPFLITAIEEQVKVQSNAGRDVCLDAATLIERGLHTRFRPVIVIAVPRADQIHRITARDGLTVEEATARVDAQMTLQRKIAVADYVIWNDTTIKALTESTLETLQAIRHAPV